MTTEIPHVRAAVIGAGLSGVAAGIALKGEGIEDFVILERAADVGGVWRDNTYPGVACDVPSHLYSLSSAPNSQWRHTFARGPEIHGYIRAVAAEHGLEAQLRFGQELLDASWDDDRQRWSITTTDLELTADLLIDATGPLTEPKIPEIEGLESFEGTIFHSARWDHDHDLSGERVAVVGTGASSIQFVPEIQPRAAHVTVFQRTPGWVMPRMDRATTALERAVLRRVPGVRRLQRLVQFLVRDGLHYRLIRRNRVFRTIVQGIAAGAPAPPGARSRAAGEADARLRDRVQADPDLQRLVSRARPGQRRRRGGRRARGARPHSDRERRVRARGRHDHLRHRLRGPPTAGHRADPRPRRRSLADVWRGGLRHYRAVEVAGFPNYFRLAGVGCGLGHGSLIFMIESQTAWLRDALRTMARCGASTVEVTERAQDEYMRFAAADIGRTVWALGGCTSWYQDQSGEATGMWPRSM